MEENDCKNCLVLRQVFDTKDREYTRLEIHKKSVNAYDVMKEMKEEGKLDFYMSDTPFDTFFEEVTQEEHYDYNIYMQCKECKRVFRLGICIRGEPSLKIFDTPPNKEEFKERCAKFKRRCYLE